MNKYVIFAVLMACGAFVISREKNSMKSLARDCSQVPLLFSYDKEQLVVQVNRLMIDFKQAVNRIVKSKGNTYLTTFGAVDACMLSDFMIFRNILLALEMVHPDESLRLVAHELYQKMTQVYLVDVANNHDLYQVLAAYDQRDLQDKDVIKKYFIDDAMRSFKKNGLHLDAHKREKIKGLQGEIATLVATFEHTIAADTKVVECTQSELSGVLPAVVEGFAKKEGSVDTYLVTLDYPSVNAILESCDNTLTRKKIFQAFSQRGFPQNASHLKELVSKRQELAELLGYRDFIAYDFDCQMAQNFSTVDSFLNTLFDRSHDKFLKEIDEFKACAIQNNIAMSLDSLLFPWDIAYIKELYKKSYGLMSEGLIAEYFPFEHTVKGLFEIYTNIFSLNFKRVPLKGLWHNSVECIQVYDSAGILLGTLLLDLFPRVGKYTHACHMDIVTPSFFEGKRQPGVSVIVANFSPATQEKPSLLKLSEVRTFFHEFGHALHSLLGATEIVSLSGTNTKLDFVELPSQLLEEWLWDADVIKKLSCHFKTQEQLPDAMIANLIALKNFDTASFVQRQIYLSRLSIACHQAHENDSFQAIAHSLYLKYMSSYVWDTSNHMYCSFGHLGGYSARYYSYLWSKIFAADIFSFFKQRGMNNKQVGSEYVEKILKPGGTQDPSVMLENFLGRAPKVDSFFELLGL